MKYRRIEENQKRKKKFTSLFCNGKREKGERRRGRRDVEREREREREREKI